MASIKSINFLPTVFQSDTNRKFLAATVDQLTSEPDFTKINGFIGRKFSPGYKPGDTYVPEPDKTRQDYQFEPAVSVSDAKKNVTFFSSYADLLQKITYNGGITSDHSRLFSNHSYNFNSLIDIDKFVNFHQYLWMPNGPPEVEVSAYRETPLFDYRVTRDASKHQYRMGLNPDGNPTITLIRGETYTFRVDSVGNPFYIQSKQGIGLSTELLRLSRDVLGVSRNGGEAGTVTFEVPLKDAQNEYTEAPSAGSVDFASDVPFKDIQKHLFEEVQRTEGGIDGIMGVLEGRTLIFVKQFDNAEDWVDPGIFDFEGFDADGEAWSGGQDAEVIDRYNIWRIRVITNTAGDRMLKLEPYKTIDPGYKVTIKQGKKYAGVEFIKTLDTLLWAEVPIITAPLNELFYTDGKDGNYAGRFLLLDPGAEVINVTDEILGATNYTSANGVRFTNGLVVRFDATATPSSYKNNLYVVQGVGRGITLVGAGNYVVPEAYASTDRLATPDYITVDRSSEDLNAWTRSNRWFHEDLLKLAAGYRQDSDILLTAENYQRAQRPIIEFDPNVELYEHGYNAKAMVDILDFTITNAFKQVEGQESYTIQLPNGKTKNLTAGMRIIFANDQDPDVSNRIYLVQFITTSQGSQIHLVTQSTQSISTYYVDNNVILENQSYSSIPAITYANPYPAIGAVQATGKVVLNTTGVATLSATYGGLNYLPNVSPSVLINTNYIQPAKFDINYSKYASIENLHVTDGGIGYNDTTTIYFNSPNPIEVVAAAGDDADFSVYQDTTMYLESVPTADSTEAEGQITWNLDLFTHYLVGPGIPGGTTITGVDTTLNTFTVSQPITVPTGTRLVVAVPGRVVDLNGSAVVTDTAYNTQIVTVDSTSAIGAGMIVSGGKPLMTITNITTGDGAVPAQVTVSGNHNFTDGDVAVISQIAEGPTDLNNITFYVKVINNETFSLYTDAALTAAYDASNSATYNSETSLGTVTSKFISYGTVGTRVTRVISATQLEVDTPVTLETDTVLTFVGVQATATTHIFDGALNSVWVTNPGSGYLRTATIQVTLEDSSKTPGPDAIIRVALTDASIEYFTITNPGTGYVIGDSISATVIDTIDETTTEVVANGSRDLTFASSTNIQYVKPGWQAWLILDNGTYADFGRTPQLDGTNTGPDNVTNQQFADTSNTLATLYTVSKVDLVNNTVTLGSDILSLDEDSEVIDLPAGSKIHFTCKTRYFTEDGTYATPSVGLTRGGYIVKSRGEYQYDAANLVSILDMESVLQLQVGMKITDAGNTLGDVRILSIESFTNSIVISRNLAIAPGTVLYASSAAELEITLSPATIKEIILTNPGAEYTAAPIATVDSIKAPITKIVSSTGATGEQLGEIIVNSLDGIDIGAVANSEFQETGYGITTGGDVIRVLSTRSVAEAGGVTSYRVTLGIARYFTLADQVTLSDSIYLPNVIGLEVGMIADTTTSEFAPVTIIEIDSVIGLVTVSKPINASAGTAIRFYKPVAQPVFGDVYATFTVAARVATTIASRNVTVTDYNDTTPETYEAGDTVLVGTPTNILQTAKGVPEYNQYRAVLGRNNKVTWAPAQKKAKINQAPLFDVFDSAGYSLGNQTYYPGSKFTGTKIFAYTNGTGNPDTVLGFRLKYKNFNNQGDILFTNHFHTDTFTYLQNGVEYTQPIRGFDLKQYNPSTGVSKRINQWTPIENKSEQYQVFSFDFDGLTTYFEIDVLPRTAGIIPTLRVYLNGVRLAEDKYTVVKLGARLAILVTPTIVKLGDKVDVEMLSNSTSAIGHYELPINYEINPFNSTFTEITLGQMRSHLVEMSTNHYGLTGDVLHNNNLRDLDYSDWQGSLLQHASPVVFAHLFMVDKNADAIAATENAAREYTRFKNRFLDMASKTELVQKQMSLADDVDKIIAAIMAGKTPRSAWHSSDMVPFGKNKTVTRLPIIDAQRRRYEIPEIFNDTVLSNRAVLVYLEDPATGSRLQLIRDTDFVFEKSIPAMTLADSIVTPYTAFLVIEDYNTLGNYIPETPSKLGLYPKFMPMIYLDNGYQKPTLVIQGHDGSITPAFGDYRDQLLLELELRIYNNIKSDYVGGIFDTYDLVPGKFRATGYTRKEFDKLLTKRFLKWIGTNRVDYSLNQWFDGSNPWTWNYNKFPDIFNNEIMPGFWRGVFKYYYDTDRPNLCPWEMLGFSEKPTWWEDNYGPSPYTGGNLTMWGDLEKGLIVGGTRAGIDARFARPGLSKVIPVDENGELISPEKLFLASFDQGQIDGSFAIGDQGPVETAWRRSSDFPFAMQAALMLGYPGYYFGSLMDTSRYHYDSELKQYLHITTNSRVSPDNVTVPDDGVLSGNIVHTAGYLNWIKDLLISKGMDGTSYLQTLLSGAEVTMAYRMAGYSDKRYINVIADQSSPGSTTVNIVVPDQNYRIALNKGTPVQRAVYSAVIVEKTQSGYSVTGYDLTNPYFTIVPSVATNNSYSFKVLEETGTVFMDYQPYKATVPYGTEYRNMQSVIDFLVSYQRYLTTQGFVFDTFNNDLSTQQDFTLSAQEFLMWAQQGWGPGTILVLSPIYDKIKFVSTDGVIDSIHSSLNNSKVLDQNFVLVKNNQYAVTREDTTFTLRSLFGQTLALVDIDIVQYEHVMLFDNVTAFNDVMYQPELGLRQTRLRLSGNKTSSWTGQLNPGGLMYNSTQIEQWRVSTNYRRGTLIEYKDKVYVATNAVPASATFDFTYWQLMDSNQIKTGLLPNWATLADNATHIYDIDSHPVDETLDAYSHGLIGFREREYLTDFNLDTTSQVKFYQGYIKRKGSMAPIDALASARLGDVVNDVQVYEDWAVRVGEYGTLGGDQYIELKLEDSKFTENPDLVVLNDYDAVKTDGAVNFAPNEIYGYSDLEYTPTVTNIRSAGERRLSDLVLAGYPSLDDVDGTLFDITDVASAQDLVSKMGSGYKLWVAKDFNSNWNVFRITETDAVITSIDFALNNTMTVNTDTPHGLTARDVIVIANFNTLFNGIYLVQSVTGNNTFSLALDITSTVGTTLRRQQSIGGTGILFKATSVRVNEIKDIINSTPPHRWKDEDKVWVDDDSGTGLWGVYKKTDGWKFNAPLPLREEDIREAEGYGTTVKLSADSQVMLVGAPLHTEGSLRGFRVLDAGSNYAIPSIITELPSRSQGIQSAITEVPLSNGVIISASIISNGSAYNRTPTVTVTDYDTATFNDYIYTIPRTTVATRTWTGNANVIMGNISGVRVGDQFVSTAYPLAGGVKPKVLKIYSASKIVTLDYTMTALGTGVSASFYRPTLTSIVLDDNYTSKTLQADADGSDYIYALNSVTNIRLDDIIEGGTYTRATGIRVMNIFEGNSSVALNGALTISTGTTIKFLHPPANVNDLVTGAGITGQLTVSSVSAADPFTVTLSGPLPRNSGPTLTFAHGSGAIITATLEATSIASVEVVDGGTGYAIPPNIYVTGGGGAGAVLEANIWTVNGIRTITSINVIDGGSGYTSEPTIRVEKNSPGTEPVLRARLASTGIDNLLVKSGGNNYKRPTITIETAVGDSGAGATGNIEITRSSIAGTVQLDNPGTGYTKVPTIRVQENSTNYLLPRGSGAVLEAIMPTGTVRCFTRASGTSEEILQINSLKAPTPDFREFGTALDVGISMAAIGAPGTYQNRGAVAISKAVQGQWAITQVIGHPDNINAVSGARFGEALAMSRDENWLYIGAPGQDRVYVYTKQNPYARAVKIAYISGVNTYFLSGLYNIRAAKELRVIGNTGRIYEAGVDYAYRDGSIEFSLIAGVADATITVTKLFTSTTIKPTVSRGVTQRVYTLDSIPESIEAISVIGASGTIYVPNRDYELVSLNQIQFINSDFASEVSITVDGIQSYFQLLDILDPVTGNTGSRYGSSIATNAEGYQVVVGAYMYQDSLTAVAAASETGTSFVVKDLKSINIGYQVESNRISHDSGIKVVAVDALTQTVTVDGIVEVIANDTLTFTGPYATGRSYVYDRSYERVVQKSTTPLKSLTLQQIPVGPTRVMIDRSTLVKDYDYIIEGKTVVFNTPVRYAAAIKVDTNRFSLVQTFDPVVTIRNGNFGKTVDISYDNKHIVIGQPGYQEEDYYNGAVHRYVNQGLAYGKIVGTRAPTLNSSAGLLKFNNTMIAFGGIDLAVNGMTTGTITSGINSANIVGLTASGTSEVIAGSQFYDQNTHQLIGEADSANYINITNVPGNSTVVYTATGSTITKLIRATDYTFEYSDTNSTWQIHLVTALAETARLIIQTPITVEITRGIASLDILPGTTLVPDALGIDVYVHTQMFQHPTGRSTEYYGTKAKFDNTGESIVISSEGGTTLKNTSFDKKLTTVDRNTTRFIDQLRGSGAVYVYDYLDTANSSITDPAEFLYNQNLQDSYINYADNFGASIDVNNGWIIVGANGYDNTDLGLYNTGLVHVFRNASMAKSWTRMRQYSDKVDIEYVNKLLLYDRKSQVTTAIPDYVDPAKGKILGVADQEIDYKTAYDPAYYNVASRTTVTLDTTAPWNMPQVGQVWWNLDACRYVDYEQGSLAYRSKHWGAMFPGSVIEICEWVESSVLPSAWYSTYKDGVAKYTDDSAYVSITSVDQATGIVMTKYYYWVVNKLSASNAPTRSLSANSIKTIIDTPADSGYPFIAVIAPNAFNFYGFAPYLKSDNTIFRFEYAKIRNNHIAHSEFELVAEHNPLSVIPDRVLKKLIDSIAGESANGEIVPDPFLIETSQTGIMLRPRQSMFKDQQKAALILVQFLNNYFQTNNLGEFNIDQLKTSELVPDSSFYQSTVANYETLTYIDLKTVYDGYRVLVQQDETVGGFWTIYLYLQDTETWFLERIQSYDTTRYWSYTDWYAAGYTAKTPVDLYLPSFQDIQKLTLVAAQLIRVTKGVNGGWELYIVNSDLTTTCVGIQNGTIAFSSLIYQNAQNQVGFDTGGFDTSGFSKTISVEMRNIMSSMIYDVFSGVASDDLDLNNLFFSMVNYILSEQKQVDWLLKTSFMSVVHKRDQLRQVWNYQRDNQTYYEDFISEIKPYRSEIKEYLLDYTSLDNASAVVTDFDLPAIYDKGQKKYRVLDSTDPSDLALIRASASANWLTGYSYSIQSIDIIAGGSGYINPVMVFTSPTGSGAVAEPTATDGVITSVLVEEGGTGYLDIPVVTLTGSTGQGFQATAVMGVDYAVVPEGGGGAGYEVGDILTYTSGTGVAVFQVVKVTDGVVDVVNTTSAGEFNTTTYSGVSTATTGNGSDCVLNLVYKVVAVTINVGGDGYITTAPRVVISGGGSGTGAKAHAIVVKGSITEVILDNPGAGYTSVPEITFAGGGGTGAKAYARLTQSTGAVSSKTQNKVIRSINTTMKFDRIAYTTNIDRWKPLRTYHTGEIVVIPDTVTRVFINVPDQTLPQKDAAYRVLKTLLAAETFDNNLLTDSTLFEKLGGTELQTVLDRIGAYIRPGTPDQGRVFLSDNMKQFTDSDLNSKIVSIENNWNRAGVALTVPPTTEYRYAVVGNRTTMAVSKDGINWVYADLRDQGVNLRGVAFVNGTTWIAYGTNGSTFETTDGINWDRNLIDSYSYSPTADAPTGKVFSSAATVVDVVDATSFAGTFANYAMVVGSKGLILMNSYGSETAVGNRWVSARVPSELIDVQYLTVVNKDFGYVNELDRIVYDAVGENPGVARVGSGLTYLPLSDGVGFKKGFTVIAGVNGHIYFSSYQYLEDLHNGYSNGYNYDGGKDITDSNADVAPVNENYPWVKTIVPRKVRGLGDGVSGEHISGIAIGDEPDIWTVAVGSGGTLLWNVLDLFTRRFPGTLKGPDAADKTIIGYSIDPFVEWREFDAADFQYPLTKADLASENFTDVDFDGEKFVATTETNLVFWGYPGAQDQATIYIAPVSQDLEVQSIYPAATYPVLASATTAVIEVPMSSLSGIPTIGMTLLANGNIPESIVTEVSVVDGSVTVEFASPVTNAAEKVNQKLSFVYGLVEDLTAGDEVTFTGRLITGSTTVRETVTLTLAADAAKGDSTIVVSGYTTVAANWTMSGTGIPTGALVSAVGKFAKFTWQLAPGSKRITTRSINSVVTNRTTIELSQALTYDIPVGTTVNFFDAGGARYPKVLTQTALKGNTLLTVDNNVDIVKGFAVQELVVYVAADGVTGYGIPGNTTVKNSREYIIAGGVSHLEKDLADKVPGVAYAGVRVTGEAFTADVTSNIEDWQPNTTYAKGAQVKYAGQVYTAKAEVAPRLIFDTFTNWEYTTILPDADTLDTQITSTFTDAQLGQRPEDIIIDGGKFIDRFNSHAPEELVPGVVTDLLQMSVFTKDPNGSDLIMGFKIFADQKNPAQYYRISNAVTTTLTQDLNYLDTIIHVDDISTLPDPNPDANRPGTVFINGEKIIYLGIDRENNTLLDIRRGASRTSIPLLHKAGSLVSDASAAQVFDEDAIVTISQDITVDNFLGNTATYHSADVSSIQQGRIFLDLGNQT